MLWVEGPAMLRVCQVSRKSSSTNIEGEALRKGFNEEARGRKLTTSVQISETSRCVALGEEEEEPEKRRGCHYWSEGTEEVGGRLVMGKVQE